MLRGVRFDVPEAAGETQTRKLAPRSRRAGPSDALPLVEARLKLLTDVITGPGPDRRQKWCRCIHCGVIARCKPDFDFYDSRSMPGRLACEVCAREQLRADGILTTLLAPIGEPEIHAAMTFVALFTGETIQPIVPSKERIN